MMFFRKRPVPGPEQPPQEITSSEEELAGVESGADVRLSRHTIRRLAAALALAVMLVASIGTHVVLAADASSTTSMIDMDMADQLIKLIKAANVLFTVFPINIFMIGSLIALGFRIFRGAKKTATN